MFARSFRTTRLLCAAALVIVAPAARAVTPLGAEFQVNTFTPNVQSFAEVAVAPDGAFVVVWTSRDQDGDAFGVFGQRYDAAGMMLGGDFQVNSYTVGNEMYAKLAMEPDGDFVIVWNRRQTIGDADVFGQRFSSSGAKLGGEFQVNTYTTGPQYYPTVAVDGDGDFVVAWTGDTDGDSSGIFAQRFASGGAHVAVEFEINTYTTDRQLTVAIGMESNGDFVVSWDSFNDPDDSFGVRAQRWSSSGLKLGGELAVNTYTAGNQYGSAIGVDADGDFVVAWTSYGQSGNGTPDVFAQRYDSSGARVGLEFQVNSVTTGLQVIPRFYAAPGAVGIDPTGDFVVVWTNASTGAIWGQGFASTGARVGGEFQISVGAVINNRAATAMESNGDFVVAWNSYEHDGSGYAVFARRFTFIRELDVDDNGLVEPLTDGLLVLRRLFGFSGATLTGGAVGGGCGRCDHLTITPYVDSILPLLDIDLSGEVTPLTDGLLILRRLFGFTGATLTTGALSNDCTRCEAGQIASAIDDR